MEIVRNRKDQKSKSSSTTITGVVRNRKDQLDALNEAFHNISKIILSSAYDSNHDPLVSGIIDFHELYDMQGKLAEWTVEFKKRINERKKVLTEKIKPI